MLQPVGSIRKTRSLSVLLVAAAAFFSTLFAHPLIAQEEGDRNEAIRTYESAQDLHEKGDLKGALALYKRSLVLDPAFPEAEYQSGVAYLALGDRVSAERSFRNAIKLREGWTPAMISLGSLLIGENKSEEAGSLLESVLSVDPKNIDALTALVELRLFNGASAETLRSLQSKVVGVTNGPDGPASIWTARAALERELGQTNAARASLARALAIAPANQSALAQLGELSLADGDIEKAREIVSNFSAGHAAFAPLAILRARVLAHDGQFDEAISLLEFYKGKIPAADRLRSQIFTARSTTPQELEGQLSNNEKDAAILGRLCALYRRSDPEKALTYCRRASEIEPDRAEHAIGFAAALVQAGRHAPAVEILRKIIDAVPDNATARANLANALFQLKRYPEAKTEFLWLTKAQPGSAGAYLFLGITHDQMSEYVLADAAYRKYLRLADPAINKTDIERINLRLPQLQRLIKEGKGKKNG